MNTSRRQSRTKYIELNTHLCEACWSCVKACTNGVLGKVDIFFHKHAKIVNAQECEGCLKCVKACQNGAISALIQNQKRASQPKTTYNKQIGLLEE
jgi:Fe-S-cluster-containing hydrogenase component 2